MNTNKETCVGIIFGGASGEHDVSIKSANTVSNCFKKGKSLKNFHLTCIYIDPRGRWWPNEVARKALRKGHRLLESELPKQHNKKGFYEFPQDVSGIDIWFPLLHGPNGEDGSIQGLLQLIGKPFIGSGVLGSALGMDKIAMKNSFAALGLPQVTYQAAESNQITDPELLKNLIEQLEEKIGYPCFIKPANLGSSVGISKAHFKSEMKSGLELACKYDNRIIIEKNIIGRELECGILGKTHIKTSVIGEVMHNSEWYDYETKYSSEEIKVLIPAPIPETISREISNLSLKACKALSINSIARVDFFYVPAKNELLINEINTMPGFTNKSMYPMLWEASGLNLEELVAELLKTATE
ncbi:D-alanine--D-alanine ligase family protein [Prochlorococcus sp. MIT 1223]|uniref:D-alanine--D-alanine ligase family protein n=1 Tax=Prochlorococcus sp. MIT 1223 TaxID=3096217 RepID=UPI002A752A66|nr:D-alanine--D-alanine ligase family protein [Prochlorococcus sp. MIT 1223]